MNEIELEYINETGEQPFNSQDEPDIDYVVWLELKITKLRQTLGDVSDKMK